MTVRTSHKHNYLHHDLQILLDTFVPAFLQIRAARVPIKAQKDSIHDPFYHIVRFCLGHGSVPSVNLITLVLRSRTEDQLLIHFR